MYAPPHLGCQHGHIVKVDFRPPLAAPCRRTIMCSLRDCEGFFLTLCAKGSSRPVRLVDLPRSWLHRCAVQVYKTLSEYAVAEKVQSLCFMGPGICNFRPARLAGWPAPPCSQSAFTEQMEPYRNVSCCAMSYSYSVSTRYGNAPSIARSIGQSHSCVARRDQVGRARGQGGSGVRR